MRALVSVVVVAIAVVFQVTVVDRIAFPGGAGPDLVLLAVLALALAGGPLAGALTGFWAGLALDVAPPGSHFAGQNALVFCLVGYACGLLADESSTDAEQGHTALFEILVMAAGAICGEALAALLGVMLSDPRVTWRAVTHVLPAAIAYDVLLGPFVLYAVAAALRLAGVRRESRRAGWTASQVRDPLPSASQGAIRQLAAGSGPRLRLSERDKSPGLVGGLRSPGVSRREPQVKFGRPAKRTATAAFAAGGLAAGTSKVRFGSSTMGRSVLGGSVFSRSSARFGGTAMSGQPGLLGRSAPPRRSSPFRRQANLFRGARGGLAGTAPRGSRGGATGLTAALRRSAGLKSPGRRWLRGTSARGGSSIGGSSIVGSPLRGRSPRGKSLRGKSLRGNSLSGNTVRGKALRSTSLGGRSARARLRMPRPKVKRRWRTGGYR